MKLVSVILLLCTGASSLALADYDDLVRRQQEQAVADRIESRRQWEENYHNQQHALLAAGVQLFAARHGGLARGAECTYHPNRMVPDEYTRPEDRWTPDDCTIMKFRTADGYECKLETSFPEKGSVDVDCLTESGGGLSTRLIVSGRGAGKERRISR